MSIAREVVGRVSTFFTAAILPDGNGGWCRPTIVVVVNRRPADSQRRGGSSGTEPSSPKVAVIGGGPAGLTAAYEIARTGGQVTLFEATDSLGGLARTEVRDGWRFDLGGHRFYTRSAEVVALWDEVMGDEMLVRDRQSRIYFKGRFIGYPLSASELVRKLGPVELGRSGLSYVAARVRPEGPQDTFEQWVVRRFGRRLFENFFRSYTEKVWGVGCDELRADWAAQRIRELSFKRAVIDSLSRSDDTEVTSLIRRFRYPKFGPGQMWETMAEKVLDMGGRILMDSPVERIETSSGRVAAVHSGGERHEADEVISAMPLSAVPGVTDGSPDVARSAAAGLRHRDFLTVALALDGPAPFPDNWIYIHDPSVGVARIQNYGAWSPDMVPEPDSSCVGLEYFCFRDDELWSTDDDELVALAIDELERIGLCDRDRVRRGWVVRVPMAYPIYDEDYAGRVADIRSWLDQVPNLQQVGRNGLHRYNNSDHSMLTGLVAAKNLTGRHQDIWSVNTESWYGEDAGPDSPYLGLGEADQIAS